MKKDNPKTTTQILLKHFGEAYLYQVWAELGMYKSAERLSKEIGFWVTEYTMRYLSYKFRWKRIVTDKSLPIYKAVLRGTQKAEFYQHIIFK
jgi:hypothetical protein